MALILTQAGLAALAAAEASGAKIQATHMAVGDGGGSTPEFTSASTGLVNEVWRGALQSITANEAQVTFEAHIPLTTGGWYIRECALYADDLLLAIGQHPPLYKPDPDDATKVEHVIKAPVAFANAGVVSLLVDPTVILASQTYVANKVGEHNEDEDAHQDIRGAVGVVAGAVSNHAGRTDNPHATTAAQVGAVPLAGEASLTGGYSMAPLDLDADETGTATITLGARNHQRITLNAANTVLADPADVATWGGGEVRLWVTIGAAASIAGVGTGIVEQYGSFGDMTAGGTYLVHLLGQGDGTVYAWIDEVAS